MIQDHPDTILLLLPSDQVAEPGHLLHLLLHGFVEVGQCLLVVNVGAVAGPAARLNGGVVDTPIVQFALHHGTAHI